MNIFLQFGKSLYSPKDMAAFRFQGIGKTILYVFFLTLITSIPLFISWGFFLSNAFTELNTSIDTEIPDFYIEDGEFFADVEEPFIKGDEEFSIILDPENEYTHDEIKQYANVIAFQQKEVIIQFEGTTEYIPLSDFQDVYIGKEDILTLLQSISSSFALLITILFLIMYIFFTGINFIQVTILGLLGLIIKNSLGREKLKFRHTWILSAYAITIPSLFFAVMKSLNITVPGAVWLSYGVALFILFLIIKEVKVTKPQE